MIKNSIIRDVLSRIEGYGDTPDYIIKSYCHCSDGNIYLTLRRNEQTDDTDKSPNATTSGGDETAGDEAAKMGA